MRAAWLWGLLLVLCAGEASAQRLPFTWDVPKVVEEIEVPGLMRAGGVPVKLRSVKSTERPEVILQHLVDRFQAWGFYIPPKRSQWLKEPQLTALDTDRLISYTFVIQTNPDGTTTVLLGEANLRDRTKKMEPFAPVFPGAEDVMTSDLEVARSVTYLLSVKASPDVDGFYKKELGERGYTQVEPGLYRKDNEELQVSVRPAKGEQLSVVVVSRRVASETNTAPDSN